jgi:hypothetical protein
MRPEPKFTGRGFEDRVVALIGIRNGERAEFEAGLFDAFRVEAVESHGESKLRQW